MSLPIWLIPLACFLGAIYLSLEIIKKKAYSHKPLVSLGALGLVIFGYTMLKPFNLETILYQLRVSGMNIICVVAGALAITALVISLLKAK